MPSPKPTQLAYNEVISWMAHWRSIPEQAPAWLTEKTSPRGPNDPDCTLVDHEPSHASFTHHCHPEMRSIKEVESAEIIKRKEKGGTIFNAIVFKWCDGERRTIEEALRQKAEPSRDLDLFEMDKQKRDTLMGKDVFERFIEETKDEDKVADERKARVGY